MVSLVLLSTWWLRVRFEWHFQSYEYEMVIMTQYAASLQASHDFDSEKLRLYELKEDNGRERYANRNEGPFEVWIRPYSAILGKPHFESQKVFVERYNNTMKTMYRKKKKE